MIEDLIDTIESLTLIMEEETEWLHGPERIVQAPVMVEAKLRLVAALDVRAAQIARLGPDWTDDVRPDLRDQLAVALADLRRVAESNRRIIARQIDLSSEMMGVVAAEAQRHTGATGATYGNGGMMTRTDTPSPISVNTTL